MKTVKISNFFQDKPLFGMDIGHGTLKVMQMSEPNSENDKKFIPKIIGYGFTTFDKSSQVDGVVINPEVVAEAALSLFKNHLIGDITTRRVAIAIPAYRTFTRSLQLPKLTKKELKEAVALEAEQYIPLPMDKLYLDYEIVRQTKELTEIFIVAVPKEIVDSYLALTRILGLEVVLIEPTLSSSGRLFSLDKHSDVASIIIDFGSLSADISIFDKHVLVTGTVQGGGVNFTESIRSKLNVTLAEAALIKTRYGLNPSKKQTEIKHALEPTLQQIVKEIRRMIRYYEEQYGTTRPIGQIVTLGGGANMPGLSEYLTEGMRVAVRHIEPWSYLEHKGLQPPAVADRPMYATVAGLGLANSKEGIFLMINLLPHDIKRNYQYARINIVLRKWLLVLLLVLIGLVVIGTYGLLIIHQSKVSYSKQISTIQTQLKNDKLEQTNQQVQDISSSLKLAVKVLSNEVLFSKLLQQIGAVMPNNTVLTNLTITQLKGGIELTAQSTNYTSATQIQVNLADPHNQIFSKVDIESIQCGGGSSNVGSYPCRAQLRALFNAKNPFLFVNQGNKP